MEFLLPNSGRWSQQWAALWRDRLRAFRGLFLGFALLVVVGLAAALGPSRAGGPATLTLLAVAVTLLGARWTAGFRRRAFGAWVLPAEVVLIAFIVGVLADEVAALGISYVAIQYRALFGDRREATVTTAAHMVGFFVSLLRLPGLGGISPFVVVIELAALALCGFLMHTLSEIFARDQARKRQLVESEQRFRAVVENLREALIITDLEDRVILVNRRVRDVLGYEPGELLGQVAANVLLPADAPRSALSDRLPGRMKGEAELYEIEMQKKGGERIVAEVSASPYRDATGAIIGTLGAITDVTEQKRMGERLRRARRLEVVGQLAGGVAHDFNNLLTVIRCHTALLASDASVSGEARQSVSEIDGAATRGATLTRQLLAFGRQQVLQPRRIGLGDVVTSAMPMLRRLVHDGIDLGEGAHDANAEVYADPLQLEHVLATLVRNASDAVAGTGTITIASTREEVTEAGRVGVMVDAAPGAYAILEVSDTGVGMTQAVASRLFEPFFTTREPGEGTGLGLASAYGVVRQSGGYMDVRTAPGAGTTFRVYLPCAPAAAVAMPPEADGRAA